MSQTTVEPQSDKPQLSEELLGVVLIDGVRHSLIWIHNRERSVSVLVDRPEDGSDKRPGVIDTFLASEGKKEVKALASHFEEDYGNSPPTERLRLRPLEPSDLGCSEEEL